MEEAQGRKVQEGPQEEEGRVLEEEGGRQEEEDEKDGEKDEKEKGLDSDTNWLMPPIGPATIPARWSCREMLFIGIITAIYLNLLSGLLRRGKKRRRTKEL